MREPIAPLPPIGAGRRADECRSLGELRQWYAGKMRAMREGRQDGFTLKCPFCKETFDAQALPHLFMVPNRGDDATAAPARVVECPNPKCTRQFKAEARPGWKWEIWP